LALGHSAPEQTETSGQPAPVQAPPASQPSPVHVEASRHPPSPQVGAIVQLGSSEQAAGTHSSQLPDEQLATHVPVPSQTALQPAGLLQVPTTQGWPIAKRAQRPELSQAPVVPQGVSTGHALSLVPSLTPVQVPVTSPVASFVHATHGPSHRLLQHTPSAQNPVSQALHPTVGSGQSAEQAAPRAFFATHRLLLAAQ
jgi:hypothetical protein